MKGIEITVIKDNGVKVIAGFYEPFTDKDFLTTNAYSNEETADKIIGELPALKEKLDRQERMSEN
jgi:hypothetical protein